MGIKSTIFGLRAVQYHSKEVKKVYKTIGYEVFIKNAVKYQVENVLR